VAPPPLSLTGRRILVVDDDRVASTILCSMLRAAGAEAEGAGTGEDALARLARTRFDLLLCDVYMPGVDGFELVRRVRQLPPPVGTIPAVAITAHPSFENRRDAQRAGFQDLVGKPVEPAELVQTVQALLRA
jgi:CheY-like chemotaxis protein